MESFVLLLFVASLFIAAVLLIVTLVNLLRKKKSWKKNFRWFVFAGLICLVSFVIANINLEKENAQSNIAEAERTKELQAKINVEMFDFKLNSAKYNREENSFTLDIATALPNDSVVDLTLKTSAAGEDHERLADNLFVYQIPAAVKDNKIVHTFTDVDFKGTKLMDDTYYVSIGIPVSYDQNAFIYNAFSNLEEFREQFLTMEDRTSSPSTGLGYRIGYELEKITDVKGAYQLDEVLAEYTKEVIPYKELEENPSNYSDNLVTYKGTVLQILEENVVNEEGDITGLKITTIRLGISNDSNEVIYVKYENLIGTDVVRGDNITVYGIVNGSTTYESTAGYQIALPSIEAMFIE